MCSSVRPSRSTCVRAAAIRRSMSALPTTRPSISVLAVNVLDFSRPHATDKNTSSTDTPAARSACATAARTACSASSRATTSRPSDRAWVHARSPAPAPPVPQARRGPRLGTATITQTVLLLPMSSSPMTSSACLLEPRLAATQQLQRLLRCRRSPSARPAPCPCRPPRLAHQRAVRDPQIDFAHRGPACSGNARCPSQCLGYAVRRQLDGAAVREPQRPSASADALGDLDARHERRMAGQQRDRAGRPRWLRLRRRAAAATAAARRDSR